MVVVVDPARIEFHNRDLSGSSGACAALDCRYAFSLTLGHSTVTSHIDTL